MPKNTLPQHPKNTKPYINCGSTTNNNNNFISIILIFFSLNYCISNSLSYTNKHKTKPLQTWNQAKTLKNYNDTNSSIMKKSLKLIKVPGVSCCVQNNCKKNVKKTFGNINVMSNFSKRSIFKFLVSKQCLNPCTNFQVHWADSY